MTTIAFSKFLGYGIGGSERSLLNYVLGRYPKDRLILVSAKNVKTFGARRYCLDTDGIEKQTIPPVILLNRFFYLEYLFNRARIIEFFSNVEATEVLAQNIWGPAAIIGAQRAVDKSISTTYFIRDESALGIQANYHPGIRKLLKGIYNLIDYAGFCVFKFDNRIAIESADKVVVNSRYMADRVLQLYGRKCEVLYPEINAERLLGDYMNVTKEIAASEKGFVLIGDSKEKGIDSFLLLAKRFPDQKFYVFSRKVESPESRDQVIYMPWNRNPAEAYKYAKALVVPSLWTEAYGRVAREARILSIPVIVANVGGLPEAVDFDKRCIADTFDDYMKFVQQFQTAA